VTWSPAHWLVGLLTLLILPLTGQYMRHIVGVPHSDGVSRLIFRSRLLVAGVANLALSNSQPLHRGQRVASVLIMVAPFFLVAAFFIDPARGLDSSTIFASACTASGSQAYCWPSSTARAASKHRPHEC
jgi:hypothetical protein